MRPRRTLRKVTRLWSKALRSTFTLHRHYLIDRQNGSSTTNFCSQPASTVTQSQQSNQSGWWRSPRSSSKLRTLARSASGSAERRSNPFTTSMRSPTSGDCPKSSGARGQVRRLAKFCRFRGGVSCVLFTRLTPVLIHHSHWILRELEFLRLTVFDVHCFFPPTRASLSHPIHG